MDEEFEKFIETQMGDHHCFMLGKPIVICDINLVGGEIVKLIVQGDPDDFQDQIAKMMEGKNPLHITDEANVRHLIRPHLVKHVKLKSVIHGQEDHG